MSEGSFIDSMEKTVHSLWFCALYQCKRRLACREKAVSIPNLKLTRRSTRHTDESDSQKGEDRMSPIEVSVSVAYRVGEMHALIRLGPHQALLLAHARCVRL